MKTRLLAIAMLLCSLAAKAQYVTIPDPAFALFLQQTFPACMNGNQLDTTCWDVENNYFMACSHAGIVDLDGIQYFDSVTYLDCSHNNISVIDELPPLLTDLICSHNQLSTLPSFASPMAMIVAEHNPLTSIPTLPASVYHLNVMNASLTSLPALPASLLWLRASYNLLTSLPNLPDSLQSLNCDSNFIQSLPALPNSLTDLGCSFNALTSLPQLPSGLLSLNCAMNAIGILPALPPKLQTLVCYNTQLTFLPALPPNLTFLACSNNNLQVLPPMPYTLQHLICDNTHIDSLPFLPPGLLTLQCGRNTITRIPSLSYPLRSLICNNNPPLAEIGALPDSLSSLNISDCPNLHCLPKVKHITSLGMTNTGITCLPNFFTVSPSSPSQLNNLSICNQVNNPYGCATYADISGRAYLDENINCSFDSSDIGKYGLKLSLFSNNNLVEYVYSNGEGNFSFDVTVFNNYETRLDTTGLPFTIACPTNGVHLDTLTAVDSSAFNRDFALQCKTGFDIAAYSVASNMIFRPANNTTVDIHAGDLANFYSASCAQGVSGTVTVKLHGPISYIAPANGAVAPSNVSNYVLTWNVADFGTADALRDFNIIIQTDTFAQSGQQACFEVNVTPLVGDNDTSNNHLYFCFDIVNSYDPNDKTAYPSGNIDTTQEWLTYRVRFQNTGTAEAQHIYITDTLDANVDAASFQLLSYSHQPNVQIKENIVRFNFPYINLPDSNTNEPGSHGYVQYKVKLKEDLPIGTTINNTAYIYFDFNPPVVTNTATNTIAVEEDTVEVGMNFVPRDFGIALYPNPANSQVTISTSTPCRSVSIIDTYGRVVLTQSMNGTSSTTISIANLPSGVYYVNVGNGVVKKLVKQ